MFWSRTFKLFATFLGYGFGSFGAGFSAIFLTMLCLDLMKINSKDNPIVPIAGYSVGTIVAVVGTRKLHRYATCSITKETLPIVRSRIGWTTESNTTTNPDNSQVTTHTDVPLTYFTLQGIDGEFSVRGGYSGYEKVAMRFYRAKTNTGNIIFDYDFLGVI